MTTTDMRGLYVHIPFCLKKCNYCDFCSFDKLDQIKRKEYIKCLMAEIRSYKEAPKIEIDTVFFGGGTPSLLSIDEFSLITSAIRESFDLSGLSEFTIEANPKTLTEEKLLLYKKLGVNRISIGLQSIHENELIKLGRIHNLADFEHSINLVKNAGFENINVDLMYGIPDQTFESFKNTLHFVTSIDVPHISLYGLIVEKNTPFGRMGKNLILPTEDEEADMYELAASILSERGYIHYEISNYAKEGYEARHNLVYWHLEEYIGVGLSAHTYFRGERIANTSSLDEYLTQKTEQYKYKTREKLTPGDMAYEFAMLALRLKSGFSLAEYREKFNEDFFIPRKEKIEKYRELGFVNFDGERISLTEKGFYISNSILADIL